MEICKHITLEIIAGSVKLPDTCYDMPGIRRVKCLAIGYFLEKWEQFKSLNHQTKQTIILNLETAFYNHTEVLAREKNIPIDWENEIFCELYHACCAEIMYNIDISCGCNSTLVDGIISGIINLESLPSIPASELCPQKYADIINRIEQAKNATTTIRTSKMYTCRRCKRSECKIENRYNRSLDEGTNLSITCVACGNQWNA